MGALLAHSPLPTVKTGACVERGEGAGDILRPVDTPSSAAAGGTLDFGRGLRFVTEDPDWIKKILIGGAAMLLSILVVGSVLVAGYWVRLLQRAARGETRPLPEWDDLGALFMDGLRAMGIYLAHVLVFALPLGLAALAFVLVGGDIARLGGSQGAGDAMGALAGLGFFGLYAIFWVAMLLLMLYLPAALTRFAVSGRFSAGFELLENVAFIRRNLVNYALSLVLYLVVSFVAQFGVVLCCVGLFPAAFWAACVMAWALGETARLGTGVA